MKFANIIMTRTGRCTIGDDIQLLAVERLYKYMEINYDDVIRIPFSDLSSYKGEYVILPLSFPFYGYSNGTNITNFSKYIIPVFLGFASTIQEYNNTDIAYLKSFEPIGCRDQYTMDGLRKNNISAYMNGCLTATFPKKRNGSDGKKKIFCVDLTDQIIELIPDKLKKDCVYTSHIYSAEECQDGTEQKAREIYNKYIEEARLVITTRLHAALPCIAAGIPVILVKENLSLRFSALQSLLPIYTKETYSHIDWNPSVLEYEALKEKILKASAKRVMDAYNNYKDIYEISEFYEKNSTNSTYIDHFTDTITFLQDHFKKEESFKYALWGITPTAELVYKHIKKEYQNAQLTLVIDQNKTCEYLGVLSGRKEQLIGHKDICCFVCAGAAIPEAKSFLKEIGHESAYFCWSDGLMR